MKKIFNIILCAAAVTALASSCDDFLTVKPIDEVAADTFFQSEQELVLYANGMIQTFQPDADDIANGDLGTDLIAKRDAAKFWYPGDIYKASDRSAWSFTNVRRANVMINGVNNNAKGKVDEAICKHYEGVGRYWRAWFHFAKVKVYGDIPWQDFLVDPTDSSKLYAPRDDREFVVHKCIEDLQYAMNNCSDDIASYKNVINKYVAAAELARTALYEGSYRMYHVQNYSTCQPWNNQYETAEDLLKICCDACEVIMNSGKYSLSSSYHDNFVTEDLLSNPEMIWVSEYSTGENARTNSLTSDYRGSTVGGPSPTKEYVDHFLNIDGTPIATDQISLYEEMAANNGRDPRLNNNVNHVGLTYKALSGETYLKWMPCQLTYSGYNLTKWNIEEEQQFQVGKQGNSIPIYRYAEVLLNYAEAKCLLGQMTDGIWDQTVGAIRKRAGMTGTSRPTQVDSWLYNYYAAPYDFEETGQDNRSNDLKGMLTADNLEIRRERVTELGHEGFRSDDLYRWHCLSLITEKNTNGKGNRGIWVSKEDYQNGFLFNPVFAAAEAGKGDYAKNESTGEYEYVGSGRGDYTLVHGLVTFGSKAAETSFGIANSGADQSFSLSEGDHGYLLFHYALEFAFKKYLYPINSTSVLTLNTNIKQNKLWE